MNKNQQRNQEVRTRLIQEHSQINLLLQQRVVRCNYLKKRYDLLKSVNPEQAEAYAVRINWHKPKLLDLLEKITELEKQINAIPQVWIA